MIQFYYITEKTIIWTFCPIQNKVIYYGFLKYSNRDKSAILKQLDREDCLLCFPRKLFHDKLYGFYHENILYYILNHISDQIILSLSSDFYAPLSPVSLFQEIFNLDMISLKDTIDEEPLSKYQSSIN